MLAWNTIRTLYNRGFATLLIEKNDLFFLINIGYSYFLLNFENVGGGILSILDYSSLIKTSQIEVNQLPIMFR